MPTRGLGMAAPILNVLLGLWLFVSAFALRHTPGQFVVNMAFGIATAVFAVMSIYTRAARYATMAIAFLLFLVSVLGTGPRVSIWHNVVVAVGIMIASALGDRHLAQGDERTFAEA